MMLARAPWALTLVLSAVLAPTDVRAQAPEAADPATAAWSLYTLAGVADLDADQDPPATLLGLGLDRRVVGRFSAGLEIGYGSVDVTDTCPVGGVPAECTRAESRFAVGLVARLAVWRMVPVGLTHHLIVQTGLQEGPTWAGFGDLGWAIMARSTVGYAIGLEGRRRFGADRGGGSLLLLRVAMPL